jgi:DNA-binding response OmpR family regulator
MTSKTAILVVHNQLPARERLAAMLDAYPRVTTTATAYEALTAMDKRRFDVALVGVTLDGVLRAADLVEQMLKVDERLPILAVGDTTQDPLISACLNAGAQDVLTLPTTRLVFHTRLNALLTMRGLEKRVNDLLNVVIPAGVSLAAERDPARLLESIVREAQELTHADAGTLYLRTDHDTLEFVIFHNNTLEITMGGTSGTPAALPEIPLKGADGQPNHTHIASHTALTGEVVNIPDAYGAEGFDFSGTQEFDERTGYGSVSFLTVPLKASDNEVLGVLQLINAMDQGTVVPFDDALHATVESMAELATVALKAAIREEALHERLRMANVTYDKAERDEQVAHITQTDYFSKLQQLKRRERSDE